jgi:hypothetical protein
LAIKFNAIILCVILLIGRAHRKFAFPALQPNMIIERYVQLQWTSAGKKERKKERKKTRRKKNEGSRKEERERERERALR